MRLQTLRLQGFKSFADRTTIEFREGLTAIVGSNGCGKSNIADSIRWVLGEQRASAMRGAKMEEVIFQGTARRRPLHFAEVSLQFDNQSGRVAIPQTEIELSRKVIREGGSEYSLNRTPCRLRDVHSVLRDTGLGSNAYAIIESSMIEVLLSDRAEERRALFEEAAGIGKYKDSRQAALRRLDSAQNDLLRLEDLVREVEAKVRTLGRQKRRAERLQELQELRLQLEVALAREESDTLQGAIERAESADRAFEAQQSEAAIDRSLAETLLEELRLEAATLGRERSERAARLEGLRSALDERQREILIVQERRSHAELRLEQLVSERLALIDRIRSFAVQAEQARADAGQHREELEQLRERTERSSEEHRVLRARMTSERSRLEEAITRGRSLAREIASGEGEQAMLERRGQEAREELAAAAPRLERLQHELARIFDQTELWEAQAEEAGERAENAREERTLAEEEVRVLRAREQHSHAELRAAEDRAAKLGAQVEARESLERGYEGFAPAIAEIMRVRERFQGVRGPLVDFLESSGGELHAGAVELSLGPLLQALVVDDFQTVRTLRRWFEQEWSGGGALWLLPLAALRQGAPGPARDEGDPTPVRVAGPERDRALAGEWVDLLLGELIVTEGDPLDEWMAGRAIASPGALLDSRGIVCLPERSAGQGILARREALDRLRAERDGALAERDRYLLERASIRALLEEAEERSLEAAEQVRVAEAQQRSIALEMSAQGERKVRLAEECAALEARQLELRRSAGEVETRLTEATLRLQHFREGAAAAAREEVECAGRVQEIEGEWDAAREAETELRVALARAEAALRETERRVDSLEQSRLGGEGRLRALDREGGELRASLEALSGVREGAALEVERLFTRREEEAAGLTLVEARLAEVDSELAELGERIRVRRQQEQHAIQERHRLELELSQARAGLDRIRDRLEIEWSRPWEALASVPLPEGEVEQWQQELARVGTQLEGLGPVNMLAIEEYAEEARRLDFLLAQKQDLDQAKENLVTAIRQINRTAREIFQATFETVRANFQRTFHSLFQGGECDLWLADPSDPLESTIEIQASPVGKKTQRIHLLSGGERTLTALALLFGIYLVKPSPFCVLDEIDAPLDESNVGRFIQLLEDFKGETQFIVITHNPRTMAAADWVYGVTMEEPGVSSIVGVELLGAFAHEGA